MLRLWIRRMRDWMVGELIRRGGKKSLTVYGLDINIDSDQIAHRELSHLARGIYEINEIKNIEKYMPPDYPVIELGGSLGVVACFCNKRLNDPSQHVVVEAHPHIASLLESNRDRNQCQFKVVQAAIAYGAEETTRLYLRESHTASSVSDVSENYVEVPRPNWAS